MMPADKIVLISSVLDQGDILQDFIEWHLELGIDQIIVQDCDSRDGSRDLLDRLARKGKLEWFTLPERDMTKYRPADTLARLARDKYAADWIVYADADEFLYAVDTDLRTVLREAEASGLTVLEVPRRNMTGVRSRDELPAIQDLTLRIEKPESGITGEDASGNIPVPMLFLGGLPHVIVRAAAFQEYCPGAHSAKCAWGRSAETARLRLLHYSMRRYDTFETKVRNTARWLADNPHLPQWWGWHWRRWIRLAEAGRLRAEFDAQFVSTERAGQLIREGTCVIDETVANWARRRLPWHKKILARLVG